jgi:hypothetical protein
MLKLNIFSQVRSFPSSKAPKASKVKSVVEGERRSNEKIQHSKSAIHRRREGVREKDEHLH